MPDSHHIPQGSLGRTPLEHTPAGRIQLGVIGRAHGVRGLVKITSHTADPADLTAYGPLSDAEGRTYALRWVAEGVAEVSRIVDGLAVKVTDRTGAEKLTNTKLFIDRSALPPPDEEEYYLTDLIGLAVTDPSGSAIGSVSVVHDYGAGASLEIERKAGAPLLTPFTAACVPTVDIAGGRLVVVLPEEIVVRPDAELAVPSDAGLVVRPDAELVVRPDAELVVRPDAELVVRPDAELVVRPDAELVVRPDADLVVPPDADLVVRPDAGRVVTPRAEDAAE